MRKFIFISLFMFSAISLSSVSKHQTQQIFNKLIKSNNIIASLSFTEGGEINAYGGRGRVFITKGIMKYADQDVMTYILSHELGHAIGHISELEADRMAGRIGNNAGFNVCPGAKKFLLGVGLESGDGIHPTGDIRLKAMCH